MFLVNDNYSQNSCRKLRQLQHSWNYLLRLHITQTALKLPLWFFAFACRSKSFAIAFLAFFLFFLLDSVFGSICKSFLLLMFHRLLPRMAVTSLRKISLYSLENVCVKKCFLNLKLCVWEHNISHECDILHLR